MIRDVRLSEADWHDEYITEPPNRILTVSVVSGDAVLTLHAADVKGHPDEQLCQAAGRVRAGGEITNHLGFDRHDPPGATGGNSRNGHRSKTVLTEVGLVQIDVPQDRDGSFEPKIVAKRQRRFSGVDELVVEGMAEWQNRPLHAVYSVVSIDAIHVQIRDGKVGVPRDLRSRAVRGEVARAVCGFGGVPTRKSNVRRPVTRTIATQRRS